MSTVIKVENVSKLYRLGEVGTGTLSHDLNRWYHRLRGKEDPYLKIGESNDRAKKASSEYVYALKDINFEVKEGEVLGIIGKNGAGKSTLLKLLSRVTSPSSGSIKIKGRTASLLEVGTGFHPELTGRENIFLNGAILGMTKSEIRRKFDEIVDFSGVERYIDTPVKRYSSGMYVRLAFAVAAHLDPEILIVDEVLAVGDAEFQKRCLGKMDDISKNEGRTIIFVSHNMGSMEALCSRGILLAKGGLTFSGSISSVISKYLNENSNYSLTFPLNERTDRRGIGNLKFTHIEFFVNNEITDILMTGKKTVIRVFFEKEAGHSVISACRFGISISKNEIDFILLSTELVHPEKINILNNGYIDFTMDKFPLTKSDYSLTLFCEGSGEIQDWIENAKTINVENGDFFGFGNSYPVGWEGKGVLVEHSINIL